MLSNNKTLIHMISTCADVGQPLQKSLELRGILHVEELVDEEVDQTQAVDVGLGPQISCSKASSL